MRPATFVKVMKELYMEDFSAIESLWQTLEIEMQVTQKNLLRALIAISCIFAETLIYDPIKEYLDENVL